MSIIPTETPWVIKQMFPKYIWGLPTKEKVLYLTFDDGPTPEITSWTLSLLDKYQAKATFFCIGENIKKHPEIFKSILEKGHTVGNHTHNHIKGWQTKTTDYLDNVLKAESIIEENSFKNRKPTIKNQELIIPKLFRPPYGQIKPKQGKALIELGYEIVMWSVLSFDWDKNTTPESCAKHVVSKSKPGSVIVFHDSVKASHNLRYALPKVLKHFSCKNYTFKAIPA